jgi:hypothetical protein
MRFAERLCGDFPNAALVARTFEVARFNLSAFTLCEAN